MTTENLHGCRLFPDGAQLAAVSILVISLELTFFDV